MNTFVRETIRRGCKYNVEKAKSKMLRYYKLHEEFPEYSNNFRFASKSSQEILDRFVSMIYGVALITWRLSFETRYVQFRIAN